MTKPITPDEFDTIKLTQVPESVYEAINTELSVSPVIAGEVNVHVENIKSRISELYTIKTDMDKDIDKAVVQYRKYGWNVRRSIFDWDDPSPDVLFFKRGTK